MGKLARILTPNITRESQVEEAQQELGFSIALRSFTNKEDAFSWLKETLTVHP